MRMLIRVVFVIFIANGIDCLGGVCDNCCDCFKEKKAESLVNTGWYNAKKENLVLKIFKKNNNDVFTSKDDGDKISFKLDEKDNTKISYLQKKVDELKLEDPLKFEDPLKSEDPLKLNDQKYAFFEIKTKGKNTVYLYCSDVESSSESSGVIIYIEGIFKGTDHISISVKTCDTENVKNMEYMFSACKSLTELDLTNFNTTNVKDMENMFSNCSSLEKLEFGKNFNTINVTNMWRMFFNCSSLEKLEIGEYFNTIRVRDMRDMFSGCSSLKELDLKIFNTKDVRDMREMFYGCNSLEKLEFGENFNTINVRDMREMFCRCRKLKELKFGKNFNTINVTNMRNMFSGCSNLEKLEFSENFNTKNVTDMSYMFSGCSSFPENIQNKNVEEIINFFKEKNK